MQYSIYSVQQIKTSKGDFVSASADFRASESELGRTLTHLSIAASGERFMLTYKAELAVASILVRSARKLEAHARSTR